MRSDRKIEQVLQETGIPVKYYEYAGTKETYIVYNEETEQPTNYADNKPQDEITWWQVHIFAPKESDFRKRKEEVKHLLQQADFTVTDIRSLYEKETKTMHVVIYCHTEESED